MKCYELQGPNGIDGLVLVDKPVPEAGAGEVLVRLTAATLNYRDLIAVKGGYGSRQKFPLVPVSDGAGVVERVGPGVQEFAAGDRVIGSFFENWTGGEPSETRMRGALGGSADGVLTQYRVFPKHALIRTPEHLSDIEAAALPCAGVTAWSAVIKLGGIKPGQTVLTQGTGGVSLFALQFAKMCGARVIATSSSDAKIERLKQLGADFTLNYKATPDWGKQGPRMEWPRRRSGRRGRRRRHAERIDPRDTDWRHDRLHRRAGGTADLQLAAAVDGDAAAAAAGRHGRIGRGPAGDGECHRGKRHEAGDRQDFFIRPGETGVRPHGKRRAFRQDGDRDRVNRGIAKWQHLATCDSCWSQQLLPPPLSFKFAAIRLVEQRAPPRRSRELNGILNRAGVAASPNS